MYVHMCVCVYTHTFEAAYYMKYGDSGAMEKSRASDKLYCITKVTMSSQVSLSPELVTTDTAKVTCSWSDHISSLHNITIYTS